MDRGHAAPGGRVTSVYPLWAIEGGRVTIEGHGFPVDDRLPQVRIGPQRARLSAARGARYAWQAAWISLLVGAVLLATPRRQTGTPNSEAAELGWFALNQLPTPLFGPDIPVLRDAARRQDRPFID